MIKAKKGAWTPFPLSTKVCRMENIKQSKEEVSVLSSFKFRESNFTRHDPKRLLKRHLKEINCIWRYPHEEFLPGELSEQGILVKSKIPTPKEIMQIDKRVENKKATIEKKISITEQDSSPSTSYISLYNIDSKNDGFDDALSRTPSLMKEASSPHEQGEEINSSQAIVKIPSERNCSNNVGILVEEGPSSYNIEEIFSSFTFDLHRKEVSRNFFQKVKEIDGQVREITEDELLFKKTNEDLMLISTTFFTMTQASVYNISMLNEKLAAVESKNKKIEEENTNLRVEVSKKQKVDDHLNSLKESILIEQELLHEAKTECFAEVQKMVDMLKVLEKYLEVASQIHQSMESLQAKIEELEEWRNVEKNVHDGFHHSNHMISGFIPRLLMNAKNLPPNLKKR